MGVSVFDERTVYSKSRLVVPADGTALLPLFTVASSDVRLDAIICSNRDTIAHIVSLVETIGGVVTQLGSVSVAAGTGYAGVAGVDLLPAIFPVTQVGLNLKAGDILGIQLAVAVVATFDVSISAYGGYF